MTFPDRVADSGCGRLPCGLMSLTEMINYQVFALVRLLSMVREREQYWAQSANRAALVVVPAAGIDQTRKLLDILMGESERLELDAARRRVWSFTVRLRSPITQEELCTEHRVLRETIESELDFKYFYHYPKREAQRVLAIDKDWSAAFEKFPSCRLDAEAAVDAWALDHGTGCVFHCMRVAEIGLRALARERKVRLPKDRPLEFAQWQDIIKATEVEAEKVANWPAKRAKQRDKALTFYRRVLGEVQAFKEVRNGVMHSRTHFDQAQAESVLNHVQEFMGRLAERLDERTNAAIRWGR